MVREGSRVVLRLPRDVSSFVETPPKKRKPMTQLPADKMISLELLNKFHKLDVNCTINQLRYFMYLCNCNGAAVTNKDLTDYFGIERHTNNKILTRLVTMDFITVEVLTTHRKKIHMTQKGWEFYLQLPD